MMPRLRFVGVPLSWIVAVGLLICAPPSWSRSDQEQAGIGNFAKVTDTLYRGAQPSSGGFNALRAMGVAIVVNFRDEASETSTEKREVESLGMKYIGIPWKGSQYPSNAQVLQFLDLVRTNPQVKIFVHCARGADRTGTMIAAYRVAVEHKSVGEAVSEMHGFHYDHFFLPQLERYVDSLPNLLKNDAEFSSYATIPNPAAFSAASVAAVAIPVIH
jgi:tyrosine-protein phosphatase SIW14